MNAAASVLVVGIAAAIAFSLLATPNGLGMQDLPTFDMFVIPIILAGILLPKHTPFLIWGGCILFIVLDLTFETHQQNLDEYIQQVGLYATIILPAVSTFTLAVASWLSAGSVERALREADRTKELEKAYQLITEQKKRLEEGIAIIQAVHSRVANGDLQARAWVAAQLVAPDLERPLGLVHPDVEDEVGCGGPGQAVPRVRHRLGCRRDARAQGSELQLVLLVAPQIGRIGEPVVVVAHGGTPDGEVVRALRQHVLVEQDLLLLAGLTRRGQLADATGRAPAVDAVVLPLLGARVVPPGSPPGRHRHIRLFDPGLHLLEEGDPEVGQRGRRLFGVGVLGLQVGEDLGILTLPEPEPGIFPVVAVGRNDMRAPGCAGGLAIGLRACHGWRHASAPQKAFRLARVVVTISIGEIPPFLRFQEPYGHH